MALWITGTAIVLSGCGGGSGGSGTSSQAPSFTVVVSPSSPGVTPGGSTPLQVSVLAPITFTSSVSVSISGLASGITVQPTSLTLSPNSAAQQVVISVAASVAAGSYTANFEGTGGGTTATATATLTVGPPENFTLALAQYTEIVVPVGGSTQLQIPTTLCCPPDEGGYALNFSLGGLPANVTASFSPNPGAPGATTTMTVSAALNAQLGTNFPLTLTMTPSVNVPTVTAPLLLEVVPVPGTAPDNRTDFIRTDGSPSALGSMVYDSAHQLLYCSDPAWNRVDIVSPVTKQIVRSVPIPAAEGVDISLDGTRVYVSSDTQQMFAIDTTAHALVQQWTLPTVSGPLLSSPQEGYGTLQPVVTSNGTVLLMGNITDTTGNEIIEWNPASNTVAPLTVTANFIPGFTVRSGDGTKVIMGSNGSPGVAAMYDSASNSITATLNFPGNVLGVQANPTGTQFIIFDDTYGLQLYDPQLTPLGVVRPGFLDTGVLFSPDGTRIYVVADVDGTPATFTVDASNLQLLGTAPAYASIPPHAELIPPYRIEVPFAVDPTGLIFGTADRGIAIDDTTSFQYLVGPPQTPIYDKILQPDAGPVNAATLTTVMTQGFVATPDVWFGSQRGIDPNLDNGGPFQISAPPAAQPGPVNVKILQPDGIQIFDPLAFSYGPVPMFLLGDTGSPAGGATADIIAIAVPDNDPSSIQVSVGGASATVLSAGDYNPAAQTGEPFPTVDVKVTLPAGTSPQAAVTLTTSAGSATLPQAFQYASQIADYSSTDSFQAVTYDPGRNQLYLSAGDHVDVFSLSSNQFTAPMALPSAGGKKQFVGMALTPDGSKLIVANLIDGSVDVVNPDNPSAATAVAIAPATPGGGGLPCLIGPSYVATTSAGTAIIVYGGLTAANCGPGGTVYELNLTSLAVIPSCLPSGFFVSASRDGSKVALSTANAGWLIYDSASSTCSTNTFYQGGSAAAAGDANVFSAGIGTTNPQAQLINVMAYPDPYYPSHMAGTPPSSGVTTLNVEKMNDSGSLVYVPYPNNVDVLDVEHAIIRQRITLSEQILTVADAMAIAPTGQNIFLITNQGLTVITLTGAPISVGSATPSSGTAGTSVTVRGSGFVQGTTASLNGQSVSPTFVDADTLTLTIPAAATGAVQFTLSNPSGQTYVLDDAFTVN